MDDSSVPNLADLARMTGLSRYQVLRRFTKVYGLPPHAWLLRRRTERSITPAQTLASVVLANPPLEEDSPWHQRL